MSAVHEGRRGLSRRRLGALGGAVVLAAIAFLIFCTQPVWLIASRQQYSYGPYPETQLDVWRPRSGSESRPAVLVFHGGGWQIGSRADMVHRVCARYLRRGFVVANVDYRLSASAPAPAAVLDCRAAVAWLADHATDFGVDPGKLVVTGESAGAYLALMTAMPYKGSVPVAAVVDFYGPVDLSNLLQGPQARDYAREWLAGADVATVERLSILAVDAFFPPTVIVHGTEDREIWPSQSTRLAAALSRAGVRSRLVTVPGAGHGDFSPAQWNQAYDDVFRFLCEAGVRCN